MDSAPTFRLDDRVALVTGSSTGIGLAMARGLGKAGATVVINARNAARLQDAAGALRADGLKADAKAFDVTDPAAVDAAVAAIEADVGPIDVLINNAGTTRRAPLPDISDADWRLVLQTNLDAAFYVGRAVARRMIARKRGRIVNTCSVMSEFARQGTAPYAASKGALKMLTKAMAVELGPHG